jgi:hypothetical protein
LPVAPAAQQQDARIPKAVNDLDGSREWDRTTDHLHVKDTRLARFQGLTPANDDE